jgi:hypothetical protein
MRAKRAMMPIARPAWAPVVLPPDVVGPESAMVEAEAETIAADVTARLVGVLIAKIDPLGSNVVVAELGSEAELTGGAIVMSVISPDSTSETLMRLLRVMVTGNPKVVYPTTPPVNVGVAVTKTKDVDVLALAC